MDNEAGVKSSPASSGSAPDKKTECGLRSMVASVMIITAAGFAALMFGLFHGLGWQECAAIVVGTTVLAGGIAYTIQKFLGHRDQLTI